MTQEMLLGTVRTILASLGGYLVGQGLLDAELWLAISGAALALVSLGWSLWQKREAAIIAQAAALPTVEKVVVTSQTLAKEIPASNVVGPFEGTNFKGS